MSKIIKLFKKIFLLAIICFGSLIVNAQDSDSLLYVWKNTENHDTVRLDAYKVYIWNNYMFYDPDSALVLSENFYKSAKEMDQKNFMGGALNHQAIALSLLGRNNEAIEKYEEAIKVYVKNGLDHKAAVVYSNLGALYNERGDSEKTGEYYFKALSVFEKMNDTLKMATIYNNLGVLYNEQKMFKLSLEYHQKSLKLKILLKDDKEVGMAYLNLGSLYGDMQNISLSKEHYEKAYRYIIKSNDTRSLGNYNLNMGHLAYNEEDYEASLNFYHEALDLFTKVGDKLYVVMTEVHLGGNYQKFGEKELALMYLVDAYEKAREFQIFSSRLESSKLLYELYKDSKEYKNALFFKEEYHFFKDSITNIEQQEATLNLKFEYDYEKKAFADSVEFVQSQELNLLRISEQEAQIQNDRTQKYALFGGIGLMLVFGAFAYRTFQRKKRDHDVITLQHQELEESHQEIKQSHHEIQQSIHYSKRLQDVFLPSDELLEQYFKNHFVLFKPKDVVSGDFYWFEYHEKTKTKIIAVADSTGHGVPGALVSIVCSNALNKAVNELGILEPADILNKTREIVIDTFTKSGKDVRDGMDITICVIKDNQLKTAGANNGLWLVNSEYELKEFKANRQPVGWQEKLNPFSQEEVNISIGDTIYLLTDGFPDQFGGDKGKKLKKKVLKEYLVSIQRKEMRIQRTLLNNKFETWRGSNEQIDDVCIVGIRF